MIWEMVGLWLILNAIVGFFGGGKFVLAVNTLLGGCILAGFFIGIGMKIAETIL